MKRVNESGVYDRNKKKAKEENIEMNEGAILKFVKLSEMPALPESTPGSSGVSSSETSVVRTKEVAQI
ncbi:hypothetical protein TNCT_175331 [Trichonephila clavata]|uniref:Uncharacterized protein n=1 Tax=Trichonephila clavata TaxID=2740835 RepID=A0A8X6GL20_TRICU|nr:hypothetical protein TNCT_175331 [Trichonephila clavata]